jgi:hypothetical protein
MKIMLLPFSPNSSYNYYYYFTGEADDSLEEENNKEDNNDNNNDDNDGEMARAPAAQAPARTPPVPAHPSPPTQPSPPRAPGAAATVNQLVLGLSHTHMADPPPFQDFSFEAIHPFVLIATPTVSIGQQNVLGYFLIPTNKETSVSIQVASDGLYAVLSL